MTMRKGEWVYSGESQPSDFWNDWGRSPAQQMAAMERHYSSLPGSSRSEPRSKDEIASAAAERIATTPAMSQEFIRAVVMDALNEAADIERYCADVEKALLS